MCSRARPGRRRGSRGRRNIPVWRPATAGSGAFGFLLQLLAHSHGWPFPAGGQGRIIDALMAIATREGVLVRCDAPVQRILVRGGRVAGVRLHSGEELAARDVVTTISARPLAGDACRRCVARAAAATSADLALLDGGVQARLRAGASGAVDGRRGSAGGGRARRWGTGRSGRGGRCGPARRDARSAGAGRGPAHATGPDPRA